jgi:hypothetical protein
MRFAPHQRHSVPRTLWWQHRDVVHANDCKFATWLFRLAAHGGGTIIDGSGEEAMVRRVIIEFLAAQALFI